MAKAIIKLSSFLTHLIILILKNSYDLYFDKLLLGNILIYTLRASLPVLSTLPLFPLRASWLAFILALPLFPFGQARSL